MKPRAPLRFACVLFMVVWGCACFATPFPFNITMEGSGDSRESEFIFPTARTTVGSPVSGTPPSKVGTTITRLKDFIFNDMVDFLRENLLLIIVVTSLLVVIIFIICCASAMSHKHKLEAYYPPKTLQPRKYMNQPNSVKGKPHGVRPGDAQSSYQSADTKPTTQNLRSPSKALVGEKEGKEPRAKPQEAQKFEEEVEREDERKKDQPKQKEEFKTPTANPSPSQPLVCTCHLRKASPPEV